MNPRSGSAVMSRRLGNRGDALGGMSFNIPDMSWVQPCHGTMEQHPDMQLSSSGVLHGGSFPSYYIMETQQSCLSRGKEIKFER